jgi:peptidoglycan/LPS O-acetylase OafA/YrhL
VFVRGAAAALAVELIGHFSVPDERCVLSSAAVHLIRPLLQSHTEPGFRHDINAMRALAVLAVVAYHYGVPGFSGGFAGVDVFFVISGFLIGGQILAALTRGDFSFSGFFLSRLRRIFPALAVMSLFCLLWGWFYILPNDYLKTSRHVVAALFFLSNLAFTGEQGYFDLAAHAKPMLHTWSLSVEGQFYLFLPLVMALIWRLAHRHLALLLLGVGALSLAWALRGNQSASANDFYLLPGRAWEFLAGCLLALCSFKKKPSALSNGIAMIGLLALLASFSSLNSDLVWPGVWTLWPVLAAVALIAAGDAPWVQPLMRCLPVQRLGDVSYSLYLWHWPVLVFARQVSPTSLTALEMIGLMLLSIFLAVLSWYFVEQPFRAKQGWWRARRLWVSIVAVCLGAFIFGLYVVATKGAPSRMPDYVQRASRAVFLNTPRDECLRRSDSTKDAVEEFCSFGTVEKPHTELLLWGDSHANQYLTALSVAAQSVGQSGLIATQGACRSTLPGEPTGLSASITARVKVVVA